MKSGKQPKQTYFTFSPPKKTVNIKGMTEKCTHLQVVNSNSISKKSRGMGLRKD